GLFGLPTVVNNVETLFNVLEIVNDGGAAFAETGTNDSTGTRLFCVSGHVARPGLYEVPFGTTLRELLELAEARPPTAVLLGGAAPPRSRPRSRGRARDARRPDRGDARRLDLRPRPDGRECGRVRDRESGSVREVSVTMVAAPRRLVELSVDGQEVKMLEGATI